MLTCSGEGRTSWCWGRGACKGKRFLQDPTGPSLMSSPPLATPLLMTSMSWPALALTTSGQQRAPQTSNPCPAKKKWEREGAGVGFPAHLPLEGAEEVTAVSFCSVLHLTLRRTGLNYLLNSRRGQMSSFYTIHLYLLLWALFMSDLTLIARNKASFQILAPMSKRVQLSLQWERGNILYGMDINPI